MSASAEALRNPSSRAPCWIPNWAARSAWSTPERKASRERFAQRIETCGTEDAFVVLAEAKRLEAEGRSIIHLQIGEPDFDTPGNIIAKAREALSSGYTHYTASAGLMQMRERYAEYVNRRYGVSGIKAENIAQVARAGADTFVAGSAIFGARDYAATIRAMRDQLAVL